MCIICLEFQRTKDLHDARRMLAAARREPRAIDPDHLQEVEQDLARLETANTASVLPPEQDSDCPD